MGFTYALLNVWGLLRKQILYQTKYIFSESTRFTWCGHPRPMAPLLALGALSLLKADF